MVTMTPATIAAIFDHGQTLCNVEQNKQTIDNDRRESLRERSGLMVVPFLCGMASAFS